MEEKKTGVIALLKILEEFSDEDHPISQPELLKHLNDIYGIQLDRRTLYKNLDILEYFGYDIGRYSDNNKGYCLLSRQFEPSQIDLLCNAVHASRFIPQKSSKELINNLLKTQSKYFKENYRSKIFIDNSNKKENNEFFLNYERIVEAIQDKKSISFNYTKYNIQKKLENRRDELYYATPYYLVYANEKTYVICKNRTYSDFVHYRLDRMKNIKFTNDVYRRLTKQEDPYQYAKNKIYMFSGDEQTYVLRCANNILDDVIDVFGKEVTLIQQNENSFDAYVHSTKQGIMYIALQYMNNMELLEPKELRDEIKETINNAYKKYKK